MQSSISEGEDMCTYLTEDQNIEEVRNRRRIIDYYEKIVQEATLLTIQNMEDLNVLY